MAVTITVDDAGFTFAEIDGWIEDGLEVSVRAAGPERDDQILLLKLVDGALAVEGPFTSPIQSDQ